MTDYTPPVKRMKLMLVLFMLMVTACLFMAVLLDNPSAEYNAGLTATVGAVQWHEQMTEVYQADMVRTPEAVK